MAKIAVLIDDDFEDIEYRDPADAYLAAGHTLIHIGNEEAKELTGKQRSLHVILDKSIEDCSVNDFDALFIPGGYSPDHLRAYPAIVSFVREFVYTGKPVFLICHAPQLLITADVIAGRKLTGYRSIIQDIKNAGAEFLDCPVVKDANLISSRNPDDLPAFIKETLRSLDSD